MNMEKIVVISNTNSRIGINLPELRFNRTWMAKGSKIGVDAELFEQMMYDTGVRYMFESGMLYTEDLEASKKVGLEPEDADTRQNIIILSEAQRKRYMTVMPLHDFKVRYGKLTYEEKQNLADYAIENQLMDMEKCDIIQKDIGKDIISAIRLNKQAKED